MTAQPKPRVAFVIQRCGFEVNGGAEVLCRVVAEQMTRHWETEILTTCALDYLTWSDHYEPGVASLGATRVRRFPVDEPRDMARFNELSVAVAGRRDGLSLDIQEEWMRAQGPVSSGLIEYLAAHRQAYDAFIFFGYLYAQSYFGLQQVAERSILAACAHDEWPIYLPMWETQFRLPRAFVFNTPEERDFLRKRFPSHPLPGRVAGIGIARPPTPDPWRFRDARRIHGQFLLYVGRIDPSKGCDTMFEWYLRARRHGSIVHKLVLIGRAAMEIPDHPDIRHLGFVSESEKLDALAACDWMLMPSPYESLSIVILESWLAGRPVIVNGQCDVLAGHCNRSSGGVSVFGYEEWLATIKTATAPEKAAMGARGRSYVERSYSWDRVEHEYMRILDDLSNRLSTTGT